MVKSTLVLVPLFGVHYALLLAVSFAANLSQTLEITWLYIDQTFSSFQVNISEDDKNFWMSNLFPKIIIPSNFSCSNKYYYGSFVALLYCFLNGGPGRSAQDAEAISREGRPEPAELAPDPVPDLHQQKLGRRCESLHTLPSKLLSCTRVRVTERKDNWKNGDMSLVPQGTPNVHEKKDWGHSVGRQEHAESLL
ncbi:uncharacterized protein CEXT_76761 [Caerostris extrusa]|uniref:Uncharacterized protein n=1 Tax=Caerostris extrusa TaxID=172846 RepID=A0AAV4V9Y4_CAEEX|nr:uncharacterized protein CEXT_76761 [Caerostris extrusa]